MSQVRDKTQDVLLQHIPDHRDAVMTDSVTSNRAMTDFQTVHDHASEELRKRLRQQAAVAELGQLALEGLYLDELLEAAVVVLKNILQVDCVKVLELLPDKRRMILRSGIGWDSSVEIGKATIDIGRNSQAAYTLRAFRPVIVDDIATEKRFTGPALLTNHKIKSGMSVIVRGKGGSFGVLGVHSKRTQHFSQDDSNFLQAVANIIAATVQRREAEEELVAHQEWLLLAQEAAKIGTFEWDFRTNAITWTKQMAEIYGVPLEKFDGTTDAWLKFVHPDDREAVQQKAEEVFNNHEEELYLEFRITAHPRKIRWISLRSQIFYEKKKPVRMVGVNLDITSRKEAEIHKDEFIGIVSHELKTPVTSLKAYAQVLQRKFLNQTQHDAVAQLAKMEFQLDKLTSLIGDLLDVTKIESGRIEFHTQEFDIAQLVDEVIEELQPTTINHTISRVESSVNQMIVADRDRVGQVLINFISNAIKYSPEARKILVHLESSESGMAVGVQDFGVGISQRDAERVFERFFRVERPHKNSFPGIGLGLYISAEIIKRHGGKIWVESAPEKGSTFWFELPVSGIATPMEQ